MSADELLMARPRRGFMADTAVMPMPRERGALAEKIHDEMLTWLFEPPTKGGRPVQVENESDILVNVI